MKGKMFSDPHVGIIASPINSSPTGLMLVPWERLALAEEESYKFRVSRENWAFRHGCVLQANDGCDKCNLEDWDLEYCPFHPSSEVSET